MSRTAKVRAWLNTPLKPRTRKAFVITFVVNVIDGAIKHDRIKRLEARIATLEAARIKELGRLT